VLAPADITEIEDGLWRWTARHPDWVPGAKAGSADDWPREVGSIAVALPGALGLIDALVPEGAEGLWRWLDERVGEAGGEVLALSTLKWHRRSRDAVVSRYGAKTSRAASALPEGIEPVPIRRAGETMFWLSAHRALVPGDRLLGGERAGVLRLCPASWLEYLPSGISRTELARSLRPLLDLPVERVLTSHGPPVLRSGREAIARAIEEAG
jgi:hypothetical protein